jgi:hypothetical protein
MRFLFFPLLICLLTGCHDVKKQQQLEDISGLLTDLDSMQQVYATHFNDTLPQLLLRVRLVERAIRESYTGDTINLELGRKLEAYRYIVQNLGPVAAFASQYSERSAEERTDLRQLRADIRAGSGDRSRYDKYIRLEKNKVSQLRVMLQSWLDTQEQCLANYRELHAEMQQYAQQLKSGKSIHPY